MIIISVDAGRTENSSHKLVCVCPPLGINCVVDISLYDGAPCCSNCRDMKLDLNYFSSSGTSDMHLALFLSSPRI
jgi:hypothetical protein